MEFIINLTKTKKKIMNQQIKRKKIQTRKMKMLLISKNPSMKQTTIQRNVKFYNNLRNKDKRKKNNQQLAKKRNKVSYKDLRT
jgi:ABC-type transport system involved in cytochrome c biogenesis ATPase subunit